MSKLVKRLRNTQTSAQKDPFASSASWDAASQNCPLSLQDQKKTNNKLSSHDKGKQNGWRYIYTYSANSAKHGPSQFMFNSTKCHLLLLISPVPVREGQDKSKEVMKDAYARQMDGWMDGWMAYVGKNKFRAPIYTCHLYIYI